MIYTRTSPILAPPVPLDIDALSQVRRFAFFAEKGAGHV